MSAERLMRMIGRARARGGGGFRLAAIAQGMSLAVCLWLYSWFQPGYVYPIMAYCILMILYLNSQDVRMVFRPGKSPQASHEN